MTLNGAIKQLHDLRCAEDMPIYYKPAIAEVINVLLMDTQEVKHGQWIKKPFEYWWSCSECGESAKTIITGVELVDCNDPSGETGGHFEYDKDTFLSKYCPNCGAKMSIEKGETHD